MRILSVLAATGAGAGVGWVCGMVPVWPVARLAAAAVSGWFVGSVGIVVFVLFSLNRSEGGGLGSVSVGLSEAILVEAPAVLLVAVVSYFVLRWLGWRPAGLARYGPIMFGAAAALVAASLALGMEISGSS